MSKNAPDFSGSFQLVQDQLTETEQRLRNGKREPVQNSDTTSADNLSARHQFVPNRQPNAPASAVESDPGENTRVNSPTRNEYHRERRRNLTLKVLESNEAEFNRLFHRLQLAGDPHRKQDLADEALQLLFTKYRILIDDQNY